MSYRVVYGETMPAWERVFETMKEARAFAKEHRSFGDIIFNIKKVVPGEPPQSLMAQLNIPEKAEMRDSPLRSRS